MSARPAPVRGWDPRKIGALAASCLLLAVGLTLCSSRAVAAFVAVDENGLPGHLSLRSDPYPVQFFDLAPGSTEHWQIQTELADASAPLTMQFKRDGVLVERPGTDGLVLQVRRCEQAWSNVPAAPSCGAGMVNVIGPTPANSAEFGPLAGGADAVPATAPVYDLGTLTNVRDQFLLVTLSIPQTPQNQSDRSLMGLEASIGFGLTADGTEAPVTAELPNTGADVAGVLVLGLGILGLGVVLRSARRAEPVVEERAIS